MECIIIYCRNDDTQKWLSCTRSGMLQAASAVLTVVLCDLAYVVMLHCRPNLLQSIDLSVPQAGRSAKTELQ